VTAYRRPDDGGAVTELRARRLAEIPRLAWLVIDVWARRVARIVAGLVLAAGTVALAVGAGRLAAAVGIAAALAVAALVRRLAPRWLRALLARGVRAERDPVALEITIDDRARERVRRLEGPSIGAPLGAALAVLPMTLPGVGTIVGVFLAGLGWRFGARLAASGDLGEAWRQGWAAVLWVMAIAGLASLALYPPQGVLTAGVIAGIGATTYVPWLFDGAATVLVRERRRLG
jgi:hypothetical protein